jgi:hypothetical protein
MACNRDIFTYFTSLTHSRQILLVVLQTGKVKHLSAPIRRGSIGPNLDDDDDDDGGCGGGDDQVDHVCLYSFPQLRFMHVTLL